MSKIKKIFTNFRVILILIFLLLSIVAIHPNPFTKGVAIRSVEINSSASTAGIENPEPATTPMDKERVISINNKLINNVKDYYEFESSLKPNRTVNIQTNKRLYKFRTEDSEFGASIGLSVYNAPTTNIRKGLDLQGGTRVLLQPETKIASDEIDLLIENTKQRINVYGLSDIVVREANDLSGNQYILVEIPGANEEEVKELISKQGKFEATIGNKTVFKGGSDIIHVGRSAQEAGIDPQKGCGLREDGATWICPTFFAISLTPDAARRFADATKDLNEVTDENGCSLSSQIVFYLDDKQVNSINVACDLKGKTATDVVITGSGSGRTREEAIINSLNNMKTMQTILITGSLPVKLNIVKTDNISPLFGEEYLKNALLIGLLALISVGVVAFIRYRRLTIAIPMILTSFAEIILLIGFTAFANRFMTVDLAAIAGMIIVIGTGVDHLIIITDETLRGNVNEIYDWKRRIKSAFFIIMAAFLTTVAAMFPLLFAGAGLLKGFALTTMVGVTIGVLIARPAYAAVIEILLKKHD